MRRGYHGSIGKKAATGITSMKEETSMSRWSDDLAQLCALPSLNRQSSEYIGSSP